MRFSNNNNFYLEPNLKCLTDTFHKTPEEICLMLISPQFDIEKFYSNNQNFQENETFMHKVVSIIEKALQCNSMNSCLNEIFLANFTRSEFLQKHVYDYMIEKPSDFNDYLQFVRSVLKICYLSLTINPSLNKNLETIIERLEFLIKNRLNNSDLSNEFKNGLNRLIVNSKRKLNNYDDFEKDFTQMNIVPKKGDIFSTRTPILKKNKINDSYDSVHDYLDTQFKLLREDFLQPLRLGVGKFREIIKEANLRYNEELNVQVKNKLSRIDSLNVYFDVRMQSNSCTDQGVVYSMKLNNTSRNFINWETSKRLIFGSLVCFSSDHFVNECLIGIVCNRNSFEIMDSGVFYVKFDYDPIDFTNNHVNFPCTTKKYIMLETTAFFESYKHVLHALVSFEHASENEFPFKENIVECKNKLIDRPNYLKNVSIDFRPLVDKNKTQVSDPRTGYSQYEFSKECSYAENCLITNSSSWPNAEQMGLDESQYEAIKLALENKLALIQGPPGTGKTYIGVKLVELLVHNRNLWWDKPNDRKRPILMVCYTNHALDQFLEYCVNVCKLDKGVVRVGSRCKNENLNSFLLSNIKRSKRYKPEIQAAIRNEQDKLSQIQSTLQRLNSLLIDINEGQGIMPFNILKKYIKESHLNQLIGFNDQFDNVENRTSGDYNLLEWLGVFDIELEQYQISDLAINFGKVNLNENRDKISDTNKFQLNDIDNQYINNERMLEDDFMLKIEIKQSESRQTKSRNLITYHEISDMVYYFTEINDMSENTNENINHIIKRRKKLISNQKDEANKIKTYFENLKEINRKLPQEKSDDVNIWKLSHKQRFGMYLRWIENLKQEKLEEIEDLSKRFNQSSSILKEIRMQQDRSVMENALIIAMTTTGSSRYHNILKDIGPRIVIVEEAAEVFEAHIVSSLSKHCEHLILIGDHIQLRPNPTVYSLAINYNLDVSLFERLINNDTKKVMLKCQHRMRPEISILMKHFYDKPIENHSSVYEFENIRGIDKNIYFINHDKLERRLSDSLSKTNQFEAIYLVKLCIYLIKQNYQPSQITILTMYLGQASELRNLLRNASLSDVKVSTVDNFQGEENDIILLSLVRSNTYEKIGFLNIHNRVCVALSRARKGFYCIGNLDFICKHSSKWDNIIKELKEMNLVSNSLKLTCNIHKENDVDANKPEDFDLRQDGGCELKCNFQLECGHNCSKYCHGNVDPEHIFHSCTRVCGKILETCGHKCVQICSHDGDCAKKCSVKVEKLIEQCGHRIKLNCSTEPLKIFCYAECKQILPCGHKCDKPCSRHFEIDDHTSVCTATIEIESKCKHMTKIKLSCNEPKWMIENKCDQKCGDLLDCGHICNKTCGQCLNGRVHGECDEMVKCEIPCGHRSKIECSKKFKPCEKGCFYKCPHKIIDLDCADPAYKCVKNCKNNCPHHKCNKKCHELCDREPCEEACMNRLKCGHQCIGICGEPCPRLCRICDKAKVTKYFFGTEKYYNAKFIYLADCKHLVESTGMDLWVKTYYMQNSNSFNLPECPKCKKPIRYNMRYSNVIKNKLVELESIKNLEYGDYNENRADQEKLLDEIKKSVRENNLLNSNNLDFDFKFTDSIQFDLNSIKMTKNELIAFRHTWHLYLEYFNMKNMQKIEFKEEQKNHLNFGLKNLENFLMYQNKVVLNFSEKRFYDILGEIKRVKLLGKFYDLNNKNDFKQTKEVVLFINYLKDFLIKTLYKINHEKELIINEYLIKCENLLNESKTLKTGYVPKLPSTNDLLKDEKESKN